VGGVPYIVQDRHTAVLVPPDNAQEMAQAIVTLCNDRTLRSRLRDGGSRAVAQYTWDQIRPQWLALYNTLVAPA